MEVVAGSDFGERGACPQNPDPEQWETLADFTEDLEAALAVYEKAREKALAINAKDHLSSIGLSMAKLQVDLGQKEAAIRSLESAQVSANKIEDKQLKAEIDELLGSLLAGQEESAGEQGRS